MKGDGVKRDAHWVIAPERSGYRVLLIGANGEEVMRAMTLYDERRDAIHAIRLAQQADQVRDESGY